MYINRRGFVAFTLLVGGILTIMGSRPASLRAQSNPSLGVENKIGTVMSRDGNVIHIKCSSGPVTVKVESTTEIWKGEDGLGPSVIHPGDEISVRGVRDAEGNLLASHVWINITAFDGIIMSVNGLTVGVRPLQGETEGKIKRVTLTDKTVSLQNNPVKKEDIQAGRHVHVVGLALPDGGIQASKFTVYVNRRPVDSPSDTK